MVDEDVRCLSTRVADRVETYILIAWLSVSTAMLVAPVVDSFATSSTLGVATSTHATVLDATYRSDVKLTDEIRVYVVNSLDTSGVAQADGETETYVATEDRLTYVDSELTAERSASVTAVSIVAMAGEVDTKHYLSVSDMVDSLATYMLSVHSMIGDSAQASSTPDDCTWVDIFLPSSASATEYPPSSTLTANQQVASLAVATTMATRGGDSGQALVMTLTEQAVTRYDAFPTDSVAYYADGVYLTDANGVLYRMQPASGQSVHTALTFPRIAPTPGVQRWLNVWADTNAMQAAVVVTTDSNRADTSYTYPVHKVASSGEHNARAIVGRGLYGRYMQLTYQTDDDTPVRTRSFSVDALVSQRRT